jgi:hypothetical protein
VDVSDLAIEEAAQRVIRLLDLRSGANLSDK